MTRFHPRSIQLLTVLTLAMIASTAPRTATTAAAATTAATATAIVAAAAATPVADARDRTAEDANVAPEIERLEQKLITAIEAKDFATY